MLRVGNQLVNISCSPIRLYIPDDLQYSAYTLVSLSPEFFPTISCVDKRKQILHILQYHGIEYVTSKVTR